MIRAIETWLAVLALSVTAQAAAMATQPAQVESAAAPVMDLASFVEQAERHDPGIAAARADMVVGQEARLRARAGFFPRVEGTWSREQATDQYDGLALRQAYDNRRQIVLTQPLLDWSAVGSYRQAEVQQARKQLQLLQAGQALRIRAVERYLAALAARDEALLNADIDAVLRQQLASARARQQGGETTLIDIRDIEVELARSAGTLAQARSQQLIRWRELEVMLGHAVGPLAEVPLRLPIPQVYPEDLESWLVQAGSMHPDVQLRRIDQRLAVLATEQTRTEYLPRASLQARYGQNTGSSVSQRLAPAASNAISVQVTIPIFSGLDTMHGVRQGLAQQEKAAHDAEMTRREASAAVVESFTQAQSQRRSIADLEAYVDAAQAALEATRVGYQVGSRREADVLQRQNGLWNARRDLLQARYQALLQGLRLKALTASLAIEDIRAVSALLTSQATPQAVSQ